MSGQGSPPALYLYRTTNQPVKRLWVVLVGCCALVAWCPLTGIGAAFFSPLTQAAQDVSASPLSTHQETDSNRSVQPHDKLRLRIFWGGGKPHQWHGAIELNEGEFANCQPLGVTADAAATCLTSAQRIQIDHWSAANYGGIDVDVTDLPETQLKLSIADGINPDHPYELTLSLQEIIQGTISLAMDAHGNRITITRAPGDRLPLRFEREHLIFEPNEKFEFQLGVHRSEWVSQRLNCRIRLQSAPTNSIDRTIAGIGAAMNASFQEHDQTKSLSFDVDATGSAAEQAVSWVVPKEEGIYTLSYELVSPWQQATLKSRLPVRRQIQFVVLGSQRPVPSSPKPWKRIASIDPSRESTEVANGMLTLGRRAEPMPRLGNELRQRLTLDGQPMLELGVGGWHAIPLSFDQLDRPHLIEIEYLADQPASIGFSLLETAANQQVPSYGVDSGVVIPASLIEVYPKSEQRLRQRHQLVCWPQEKHSYLLIANRDSQHAATIGKVEVYAGPERLPAQANHGLSESILQSTGPAAPESSASSGGASDTNRQTANRKFMVFSESGLFAKNFGAREGIDPAGNTFDDWQTFYSGADRLVQYLKANGYGGAFLTVAVDGSTLYPSTILGNSPRLDTGQLFSTGQDPIRKDVLELLFRLCEREGLTLVPAMVLNGPLLTIEQGRHHAEGSSQGCRLMHWNSTVADLKLKNNFPIYNPLDKQVQIQVEAAIDELSSRYRRFESFGGIAVVCRPDTYAILPGQQWCYDDETIGRFWQENSIEEPWYESREERLQYLLGTQGERWFQWRSQALANWYLQLAATLRQHRPSANLFLAPVDLYRNEEMEAVLAPNLHTSVDFRKQMMRLGWDANQLAELEGVQLLRPKRLAPNQSLAKKRQEITIDNLRNVDEFFLQAKSVGDLFVHRMPWAHFAQLEEQAPFQSQQSAMMRLQPLTPAGVWNRQRFLNALRAGDSQILVDGGVLLATGQESELIELVNVFQQLPALRFEDVGLADSSVKLTSAQLPVVVRQRMTKDGLWFYALNASPWPTKVRLQVSHDSGERTTVRLLSEHRFVESDESGLRVIEIELGPLSLTGGQLPGGSGIERFQFELPPNAADRLRKQVHLLQSKLLQSAGSQPLMVLKNGDFEIDGQPALAGWDIGQQGTRGLFVNRQNPHQGEACLQMKNEDSTPIWIRSNSFPLPETGRLSISVWLRTANPNQQPPLRISVEGSTGETNYYRFGSIGGLSPDPQFHQLSDQWQRFAVHFDDLPIERLTHLRVGLDLMGAGLVEVDQFEIFDRWFDERDARAISQRLASSGPLLANPLAFESCRQLLGSYWLRFLDEHIRTPPAAQIADGVNPSGPANQVFRLGDDPSATDPSATDPSATDPSATDPSAKAQPEGSPELNERGLFRRMRRAGTRIQR